MSIFEIRDPIHGFISLNELEWEIVNHSSFQRLRRIRQLAWTDMVYPSATHNRFAHSLGVMHVASRLFDAICTRSKDLLQSEFHMLPEHWHRYRQILRIAALAHDLGHGPFSHAAEEVLPLNEDGQRYAHEDYTAAILEYELNATISNHLLCRHLGINTKDIMDVFRDTRAGPNLVLKGIVAGQMDADRMDYLLRDSYHAGVSYGRYDLDRVLSTIQLCVDPSDGTVQMGIADGGLHALEGLLLARYMMFTQLYFHKTRVIYDHHLVECLRELLVSSDRTFTAPTQDGIKEFLKWHDWRVLGAISSGEGGEHGKILFDRTHYRLVHETPEIPSQEDLERLQDYEVRLDAYGCVRLSAEKSWYKTGPSEILVVPDQWQHGQQAVPLSRRSALLAGLASIAQQRLYVPGDRREEAMARIEAGSWSK